MKSTGTGTGKVTCSPAYCGQMKRPPRLRPREILQPAIVVVVHKNKDEEMESMESIGSTLLVFVALATLSGYSMAPCRFALHDTYCRQHTGCKARWT